MRFSGMLRLIRRIFDHTDLYAAGAGITGISVAVRDLERAVTWYCERLGLSIVPEHSYSGEVHLGYLQREKVVITLFPCLDGKPGVSIDRRPILFTRKLDSVHSDFAAFGVEVGPIQSDSGGNRFFRFRDLEGNEIEVCVEPRISK